MKILVTGGAGFIGSAVVRYLLQSTPHSVACLDKLTYAGNLESLHEVSALPNYHFYQVDICDAAALNQALDHFQPTAIMHLAAESHVDRSIDSPDTFIQTNIVGTYQLLEACRRYYQGLSIEQQAAFRLHHISTDEVYGDLEPEQAAFNEAHPYAPSSPYSASKASSDHLVRAWYRTYGLPIVISNCSNNYGPYQFPEKLIPHMLLNALAGKPLPLFGDGSQIRDWLYVEDHAQALVKVLLHGTLGQTYNIGGHNEQSNLNLVQQLCELLEELAPNKPQGVAYYRDLIEFVQDRPGHDRRYAVDASKIAHDLGWSPQETFSSGLRKTVLWYLQQRTWWQHVLNGQYRLARQGLTQAEPQGFNPPNNGL